MDFEIKYADVYVSISLCLYPFSVRRSRCRSLLKKRIDLRASPTVRAPPRQFPHCKRAAVAQIVRKIRPAYGAGDTRWRFPSLATGRCGRCDGRRAEGAGLRASMLLLVVVVVKSRARRPLPPPTRVGAGERVSERIGRPPGGAQRPLAPCQAAPRRARRTVHTDEHTRSRDPPRR